MAEFKREKLDEFLGVVRKYMQMRGGLAQKDLAEKTDTGVSTMSRFLNKKTQDLDAQLIARIVAKLQIPMHEIIDFIDEEFTDKFKRMVSFFGDMGSEVSTKAATQTEEASFDKGSLEEALVQGLGAPGAAPGVAQKSAQAQLQIGGNTRTLSFTPDELARGQFLEKIRALSPRQKAYVSDFLNLDVEARDLMVDLGNSLFHYFRLKGMEF